MWLHVKLSRVSLRTPPRDSLVADEDAKKQIKELSEILIGTKSREAFFPGEGGLNLRETFKPVSFIRELMGPENPQL